jgi:hypothetical protein
VNRKRIVHNNELLPSLLSEPMVIVEDEFTDEDAQTPSSIDFYNNTYYIPIEDLDKGGFTGQLELGWSDMYYDMY